VRVLSSLTNELIQMTPSWGVALDYPAAEFSPARIIRDPQPLQKGALHDVTRHADPPWSLALLPASETTGTRSLRAWEEFPMLGSRDTYLGLVSPSRMASALA